MSISFRNVPLCTPSHEVAAWIESHIPLERCVPFAGRTWPGTRREKWAFPGWRGLDRIQVNRLLWPGGADRCAIGWFLADATQLAAIGALGQSGTFILSDSFGNQISTTLWLLSAVPLTGCTTPDLLYLLTFVDDRYFWREQAAIINLTPNATTWTNLYSAIGTALGVSITADAIPAAYLKPDGELAGNYDSLTQQLDAVAFNCGQRIVRKLDGTVHAYNAVSATALQTANLAAAGPRTAGNAVPQPAVPATLTTAFRVVYYYAAENSTVRQHARYGVMSAAPGGVPTVSDAHVIHDNCVAHYTLATDGASPSLDNSGELNALAAQVASDWYAWQVGAVEASYASLQPWQPGGFADVVEWTHRVGEMTTRIRRQPWNDLTEEMLHRSATYGWPPRLTVRTADGAGAVADEVDEPTGRQIGLTLGVDTASGLYLLSDSIAGAATLGLAANSSIGNPTFSTVTVVSAVNLSAGVTITLAGGTMVSGPGYFTLSVPLEICGFQFWCCKNYTLPSASNNSVNLPGSAGAATVYLLSTPSTNATINGIIPAQLSGVDGPQIIALINADSGGKTITLNFLSSSAGASDQEIIGLPAYGTSVTLAVNDVAILWWDKCTSSMWRMLTCSVQVSGGATVGQNTLSSQFSTSSSSASWTTVTNIQLVLPSVGKYLLNSQCFGYIASCSNGDTVYIRMWDGGNVVGQPDILLFADDNVGGGGSGGTIEGTCTLAGTYTASGSTTITLQVYGSADPSSSNLIMPIGPVASAGGATSNMTFVGPF